MTRAVWDVEDEELLTAVERHLAQATETAARQVPVAR
jgi:hypothetical protein